MVVLSVLFLVIDIATVPLVKLYDTPSVTIIVTVAFAPVYVN